MGERRQSRWRWWVLGLIVAVASAVVVQRVWQQPSAVVAVVQIAGPMAEADAWIDVLERVRASRRAKAVVVRINTPGGDVAVAQEVFEALRRVREAGKPVVAAIGSVGASGGYYAAAAAQEIWALPGSLTGSIGVIYERLDVSGLASKLGVSREALTAGEYKDAGSMWRKPTVAEAAMMRAVVDDIYRQFTETVMQSRNLSSEVAAAAAGGRVWTGEQARERGLVDRLGSWREAARRAAELAGLPPETPVERWGESDWLGFVKQRWDLAFAAPPAWRFGGLPRIEWAGVW